MNSIKLTNNKHFYHIAAVMIALSLFVAGRFGFFDILGLKRVFEVLLFLPIGLFGCLLILMLPNIWLNPYLLLPFSYFICQIYWNPDWLVLGDLSIATLICGAILALGQHFAELIIKYTINIATFFAALGLIQFCILVCYPTLVNDILLFYDNYSGSNVPVIQNCFQLFGLSDGTTYHLWGMAVTRLRSFASEPSLLVGYFLIPGALAFTYNKQFFIRGVICIMFCICSFAGSVYATLCISAISLVLMLLRKEKIATIFPFILLGIFIWILYYHFSELILMAKSTGSDYDFLDKTNSANVRFSYIREFIPKALSSPFGLDEELHQPLGLLIGSAAHGGLIGFILAIMILIQLFSSIGSLLSKEGYLFNLKSIGLLIIYGSLITGMLYLDNCFIQIYGFTTLLLVATRLHVLKHLGE